MSHFTKIGGTGYQITGGKTKIGGTGYQITGGKTKIGGTSYNINFNNLTLSELFANAKILGSIGASDLILVVHQNNIFLIQKMICT